MPGTRWRWISACTSYHTCRNPEMCQPSLPRRWLKREAADGPPGRDIPDNLWLASGKNRRFNSKGICKKWEKNSAWRCIRYRWSLPTKTTNLSNQSIGKVPSFESNSWHGYNFVHLFVSHLLEANETLVSRGARKRNRKNDETFTLKRQDCKHISPCLEPGLSFWVVGLDASCNNPLQLENWTISKCATQVDLGLHLRPKAEGGAHFEKAPMAHGEIPILGYWLKREGEGRDRPARQRQRKTGLRLNKVINMWGCSLCSRIATTQSGRESYGEVQWCWLWWWQWC